MRQKNSVTVLKNKVTHNKCNWSFLLSMVILVTMCYIHALGTSNHTVNFVPINGTFQNYNPVRRLMSGQIPYRDFQDYLGLGHLYTGSLITLLFGGNYRASLVAFSFLAILSFALLTFAIGTSITKRKEIAGWMSVFLVATLLMQPMFLTNALYGTSEIEEAVSRALDTGNSARFLRGMIVPVSIGILLFLQKNLKKWKVSSWLKVVIATGMTGAVCFIWSNDYGISCWVCLNIMCFFTLLVREKKIGKTILGTVLSVLISLIAICVLVELFTFGHLKEWYGSVFGTGGYQSWYYDTSKSYFLFDVDFSFLMMLQACIVVLYLFRLWKEQGKERAIIRYGIPAFANMAGFCAVNEYKILSGGSSREVALSILYTTVIFEILNYIIKKKPEFSRKMLVTISMVLGISVIVSTAQTEIKYTLETKKEGEYISELGGYNTNLGEDLIITKEWLKGKTIWSTYASGQEVVNQQFQPSGTDYIIHVLGDKQRKQYLKAFKESDVDYAVTIREDYSKYEYWVRRANWFFYRELYKNWHPVYSNSYELYWERNEKKRQYKRKNQYEVIIEDVDATSKKLIINTDESVNGIADIKLDYKINVTGPFVIQSYLLTEDTRYQEVFGVTDRTFLRKESCEYIPMNIINGRGEILLSSQPATASELIVNSVSCNTIYTVMYKAGNKQEYMLANLTNTQWDKGCSRENNMVLFRQNRYDLNTLQNAQYLVCDNKKFHIINVESDTDWIRVTLDSNAEVCKYPAKIRIE